MTTSLIVRQSAPLQTIPARRQRPVARRLDPELQQLERRLRIELDSVLRDGACRPAPRAAWDDNARSEPRTQHASMKERTMIRGAARAQVTTPERVLGYHLVLAEIDLAAFDDAPPLADLLFVRMAREQAEAMAGQSLAYAIPTAEHRERAARLTEISVTTGRVFCQLARQGRLVWPRELAGAE